jgi:hypothetical protein
MPRGSCLISTRVFSLQYETGVRGKGVEREWEAEEENQIRANLTPKQLDDMKNNKLIIDGYASYVPKNDDTNAKMVLTLKESDLDEKFVRSTGNGGQKVNKSSSKVSLIHKPSGVQVFCQDARDLSTNRERARKYLIEKLDVFYNQEQSKQSKEQEKFRKRKQNSKRKSKKKYDVADGSSSEGSDGDMADTDANEEEQDLHLSFDEQLLIQQAISRIAI